MVTVTTTFSKWNNLQFLHIFILKIPIFPYTLGMRIVFFLLPEAFCGLKYAENAIAAGAMYWAPLGELTTLTQTS